jgi:uncharacterized protein (DUF58 family)
LSRIHWKATARHGRLVIREDTGEQRAHLIILLDCGRAMTSRHGDRSRLDWALAAALALLRLAVGRGDRVSVVAFSDRIERAVGARPGRGSVRAAYQALFDLSPRLAEPAFELATDRVFALQGRGATVVLMTSVVDLSAAERIRATALHLGRRHRPLLVNLEDPALAALARGAPDSPPEAFAKVAAMEILLDNRRLARALRQCGVRVVIAEAQQLASQVLAAYLALFEGPARRGAAAPRPGNARRRPRTAAPGRDGGRPALRAGTFISAGGPEPRWRGSGRR